MTSNYVVVQSANLFPSLTSIQTVEPFHTLLGVSGQRLLFSPSKGNVSGELWETCRTCEYTQHTPSLYGVYVASVFTFHKVLLSSETAPRDRTARTHTHTHTKYTQASVVSVVLCNINQIFK